jgi:hypothetical protein
MRNVWFDRSATGRRRGLRRAMVAAWAIVFALFALVLAMPDATARHRATADAAIATLLAHVQPTDDSCHCGEFDRLEMAPAPSLC